MFKAAATTDSMGSIGYDLVIGTGGHGDTNEVYSKEYRKEFCTVPIKVSVKTGEVYKEGVNKGKPKFKRVNSGEYKKRFTNLSEVEAFNYSAFKELLKVSGSRFKEIDCYNLIADSDNKPGEEYIAGLAIAMGCYEVRIVNKKVHLMQYGQKVRVFRGRS